MVMSLALIQILPFKRVIVMLAIQAQDWIKNYQKDLVLLLKSSLCLTQLILIKA